MTHRERRRYAPAARLGRGRRASGGTLLAFALAAATVLAGLAPVAGHAGLGHAREASRFGQPALSRAPEPPAVSSTRATRSNGFASTSVSSTVNATTAATATATASVTATAKATATMTAMLTATATATATAVVAPTATVTATVAATATMTATAIPTPTPTLGPLSLLVDDPGDGGDHVIGDRRCATASGACTLRAALEETAALPGDGSARIVFAGAMTIDVPEGRPLPAIEHAAVIVSGRALAPPVLAVRGRMQARTRRSIAAGLAPGSLLRPAQAPASPRVVLQGVPAGPAPTSADAGLAIRGGPGSAIEGLTIRHFAVGVLVGAGARGARIGSDLDGADDPAEGNLIADNGDGIRVETGASGSTIRFNTLRDNLRHGIWLESSRTSGHLLSRNGITGNGRAAIAVAARASELPPPVIERVAAGGSASGRGCPGCIVEVFADPAAQAARYVDGGTVEVLSDGTWRLAGLAFDASTDVALTATQRDATGSTSRLSEPVPIDPAAAWRLISAPGPAPGALTPDARGALERRYRIVDRMGMPVRDATVTFEPFGDRFRFESGLDGAFDAVLPVRLARDLAGGQIHASLGALERRSGERHTALWRPQLAVGVSQASDEAGSLSVDLQGLTPDGLGATLILTPTTASGALGSTGVLSDAVGASYAAAPDDLRDGPFAWHEALARGGGIHHFAAHVTRATARIEVVAPADASRPGGPAGACTAEPSGATIARWDAVERAWTPLATTIEPLLGSDPGPGPVPGPGADPLPRAADVLASTEIAIDGGGDGTAGGWWDATVTVGFDVLGPSISLFVRPDARVERWPAVLGRIEDDAAGVRAATGVTVTIGGIRVPSRFDPVSREIVVDGPARDLPADLPPGPAELRVEAVDGFCNASARAVIVRIARSGRAPTRIHLPIAIGPTAGGLESWLAPLRDVGRSFVSTRSGGQH